MSEDMPGSKIRPCHCSDWADCGRNQLPDDAYCQRTKSMIDRWGIVLRTSGASSPTLDTEPPVVSRPNGVYLSLHAVVDDSTRKADIMLEKVDRVGSVTSLHLTAAEVLRLIPRLESLAAEAAEIESRGMVGSI